MNVKYNGIGFNPETVTKRTEQQFIDHGLKKGYWAKKPIHIRRADLKSVYQLCVKAVIDNNKSPL